MKVLILADKTMEIFLNLENSFKELKIDNEFYIVETTNKLEIIYKKLKTITHVLIIISTDIFSKDWFIFTLAFCLGKNKPAFLFLMNDEIVLPKYCYENINYSMDIQKVNNYYQIEIIKWEKKIKKETALDELKEMGYSFSDDSLFKAAAIGEKDAIELFFIAGISANLFNSNGVPLLSIAVRNNHRNLIALLLSRGADINAVSDDRGNTALMDAATIKSEEIISDLIHAEAKLNMVSKNGQTALMMAIGQKDFKTSDLLIRAGADVSIKDNIGMTAKKYAGLFKCEEIIKIIKHSE